MPGTNEQIGRVAPAFATTRRYDMKTLNAHQLQQVAGGYGLIEVPEYPAPDNPEIAPPILWWQACPATTPSAAPSN